ncbi:MAG: ABC transporter permease, partial [Pyrinomonadaceae bacterium]|nr:ABC transporter permease [Pyrinomonadaceae bacterium]
MDSLVASNIRQRPLRTLISVLGVALGVTLVMLFTGLAHGMSNDLQRRSSNMRAEIIFTRPGSQQLTASLMNLSTQYVPRLEAVEGVERVTPVAIQANQSGRGFGFENVEGVEWESFAAINETKIVRGRAPAAVDEIVIDETKARNASLDVGSTLRLFGNKPYRVVGVYAPESGARIKMPLTGMQDALEAPGRCSYIL